MVPGTQEAFRNVERVNKSGDEPRNPVQPLRMVIGLNTKIVIDFSKFDFNPS